MAQRDIYLKIRGHFVGRNRPVLVAHIPHAVTTVIELGVIRDCRARLVNNPKFSLRRLTALIYREYLDSQYLVPKPDKLIAADINEPAFPRRVPGTVIYARPGDWLRIHVKNADSSPHSFHIHGVRYGIDSDGSWPFGTQSDDGRRSDEICPGQTWTYTYEVTEATIGAWPFHDHYRNIGTYINRGLFGGLVVLPEKEHEHLPQFPFPPHFEERVREVLKHLEGKPGRIPKQQRAVQTAGMGGSNSWYGRYGPDAGTNAWPDDRWRAATEAGPAR